MSINRQQITVNRNPPASRYGGKRFGQAGNNEQGTMNKQQITINREQ